LASGERDVHNSFKPRKSYVLPFQKTLQLQASEKHRSAMLARDLGTIARLGDVTGDKKQRSRGKHELTAHRPV
jgi:hypothetical protein